MHEAPKYPRFTGREPCRSTDPDAFFPDTFEPQHVAQLRRICGSCPMRDACAEYAIWFEDVGYWGGLSAPERRRIRQQRGIRLRSELRQSAA
jgi:WhiB family redox-sensing transcriptional regulator